MTAQLSLIDEQGRARQARDEGMSRALAHAEADTPSWGEIAYGYLCRYAETHERFVGWFVHHEAEKTRAVPIASGKAWGSVLCRAARNGIILKDGYMPDPNRKMNPAPVWRSLVFHEAA